MRDNAKKKAKEWFLLTFGTLLMAVGVYFFKFPNNFSTGGVSGISVILSHYTPGLSSGDFVFVINLALLLLGFAVFGKSFGIRTAYSSTLMSVVISLLERVLPMSAPMTHQPFLELMFAVGLPAVGSAMLFNIGASSGGTDIIAMILRKFTSLNIGKALLLSDCAITLAACIAFGMETGLFCIAGLLVKSVMVDLVLENINTNKFFHIITTKPDEIKRLVTEELHRGATELHGEGAFTHEDRTVLLTVVNRRQAIILRQRAKEIDPSVFLLITNSSEIIGKGFQVF